MSVSHQESWHIVSAAKPGGRAEQLLKYIAQGTCGSGNSWVFGAWKEEDGIAVCYGKVFANTDGLLASVFPIKLQIGSENGRVVARDELFYRYMGTYSLTPGHSIVKMGKIVCVDCQSCQAEDRLCARHDRQMEHIAHVVIAAAIRREAAACPVQPAVSKDTSVVSLSSAARPLFKAEALY